MSVTVLKEIVKKTAELTNEERRELSIELLEIHKNEIDEEFNEFDLEESRKLALESLANQLNELTKLLKKWKGRNKLARKQKISPNIEWLKKHHAQYKGNYVALKNGELIAVGKTIKEADLKAKKKGEKKTLLHYIPAKDEEVWGGW